MISESKKIINILLFLVLLLFGANHIKSLDKLPKVNINKDKTSYTFNTNLLKYLNGGNARLISSYLWTTTLLFSDEVHVKDHELSWMYYRFNTISELNPKFFQNYYFGGLYLSIVKDDVYGAEKIYTKGLVHYPQSYKLWYNKAFNLYFEIGDRKKGLDAYYKLGSEVKDIYTKFPYYDRLLHRLEKEVVSQEQLGSYFLENMLSNVKDEERKKQLIELYKKKLIKKKQK